MRNRFVGIILLCMALSLFAGCGSVQAKDSGNKETANNKERSLSRQRKEKRL